MANLMFNVSHWSSRINFRPAIAVEDILEVFWFFQEFIRHLMPKDAQSDSSGKAKY